MTASVCRLESHSPGGHVLVPMSYAAWGRWSCPSVQMPRFSWKGVAGCGAVSGGALSMVLLFTDGTSTPFRNVVDSGEYNFRLTARSRLLQSVA